MKRIVFLMGFVVFLSGCFGITPFNQFDNRDKYLLEAMERAEKSGKYDSTILEIKEGCNKEDVNIYDVLTGSTLIKGMSHIFTTSDRLMSNEAYIQESGYTPDKVYCYKDEEELLSTLESVFKKTQDRITYKRGTAIDTYKNLIKNSPTEQQKEFYRKELSKLKSQPIDFGPYPMTFIHYAKKYLIPEKKRLAKEQGIPEDWEAKKISGGGFGLGELLAGGFLLSTAVANLTVDAYQHMYKSDPTDFKYSSDKNEFYGVENKIIESNYSVAISKFDANHSNFIVDIKAQSDKKGELKIKVKVMIRRTQHNENLIKADNYKWILDKQEKIITIQTDKEIVDRTVYFDLPQSVKKGGFIESTDDMKAGIEVISFEEK